MPAKEISASELSTSHDDTENYTYIYMPDQGDTSDSKEEYISCETITMDAFGIEHRRKFKFRKPIVPCIY